MRSLLVVSWVGAWALMVLPGCGPGAAGATGTCVDTAACGGDVVGKWTITSSCLRGDVSIFTADCPTSTSVSIFKVTGDLTYSADLTFTANETVSGSTTVLLPTPCHTKQGVTMTCAELSQTMAGDPRIMSATCVDADAGACRCAVLFVAMISPKAGTYATTTAGVLTETTAGPSDIDFCVKGNTLTESPHAMGQATVSGTISFTRP